MTINTDLSESVLKTSDIKRYSNHQTHLQAVSTMLTNRYTKLDKLSKKRATYGTIKMTEQLLDETDYLYGIWRVAYALWQLDML